VLIIVVKDTNTDEERIKKEFAKHRVMFFSSGEEVSLFLNPKLPVSKLVPEKPRG